MSEIDKFINTESRRLSAKGLQWGMQSSWFMGMSFFEGDENVQKLIIVKAA